MKTEEALRELSMHLTQCGALMPIDWVTTHGEGSRTMEAFKMAMEALKEREEAVRINFCFDLRRANVKKNFDSAIQKRDPDRCQDTQNVIRK